MVFLKIDFACDENADESGIAGSAKSKRCPLAISKTAFCLLEDGLLMFRRRLFGTGKLRFPCDFPAFSSDKHVVFVERLLVTNCMIGYYA